MQSVLCYNVHVLTKQVFKIPVQGTCLFVSDRRRVVTLT